MAGSNSMSGQCFSSKHAICRRLQHALANSTFQQTRDARNYTKHHCFVLYHSKTHTLVPLAHLNLHVLKLNYPLLVQDSFTCSHSHFCSHPNSQKSFVSKNVIRIFSHQLLTLCQPFHLISNCFYINDIEVKQF